MRKYKKDSELAVSIGVYPTLELFGTHLDKVTRVMISSKAQTNKGVQEIIRVCKEKNIPVEQADTAMRRIAESENAYAIGVFRKYKSQLTTGNHLVLVNPSDKGNLGTIIRTMLAFGITNLVVIRPAVDIFDPKVVRASMGAVFKINFEYFNSTREYLARFKNKNYVFMTQGEVDLPAAKFEQPFSLVFGNEAQGLSKEYLKLGTSVKIPQSGEVDSLNLAVSVGLGLYASSLR